MRISTIIHKIIAACRHLVATPEQATPPATETDQASPALDCPLCRRPMVFVRTGSLFDLWACGRCRRFHESYSATAGETTKRYQEQRERREAWQQRKRRPRPAPISRRIF